MGISEVRRRLSQLLTGATLARGGDESDQVAFGWATLLFLH